MTWEQRFGALIELEGDEWDAAHKRLEQEWLAAYTAAFIEIAVSRGWRRENAETWPVGIATSPNKTSDQGADTTADCGFPGSKTVPVLSS
jgi:hypothetical protein